MLQSCMNNKCNAIINAIDEKEKAMRTDKNILIAFVLNLAFSIFEFVGGALTGSVAISSDALHDLGDAASIGVSYFLEHKSKKDANDKYTFGYGRYSVLGGLLTSTVLLLGSIIVIIHAVQRLWHPVPVAHDGMLIFALLGIIVNFTAAQITRGGSSTNQKAVNLHMLEDMMGWIAVLVGSVIIKFTNWTWIDPVLSILVALTILYNAWMNLIIIVRTLADKVPEEISIPELRHAIEALDAVQTVRDIKVWNIDSNQIYAIIHVESDASTVKQDIRHVLANYNIVQCTIECDNSSDAITVDFTPKQPPKCNCGHHHHHFPSLPIKKK